jgi:hypothetical protein
MLACPNKQRVEISSWTALTNNGRGAEQPARRKSNNEEAIVNILQWYLPYAMFSGACDVLLPESEARTDDGWRPESAERKRETDEPPQARAA